MLRCVDTMLTCRDERNTSVRAKTKSRLVAARGVSRFGRIILICEPVYVTPQMGAKRGWGQECIQTFGTTVATTCSLKKEVQSSSTIALGALKVNDLWRPLTKRVLPLALSLLMWADFTSLNPSAALISNVSDLPQGDN